MEIKRISSGIKELDAYTQGGYEKGSMIVIKGGPGTGKTIFALHFIWEGLKNGERCLYITFDESKEDLIKDAKLFGMDIDKYIGNLLHIEYYSLLDIDRFLEDFINILQNYRPNRLVIDPISVIEQYVGEKSSFRKFLSNIKRISRDFEVTILLTEEEFGSDIFETKTSIESVVDFVADCVIHLYYPGLGGEYDRSLRIVKMRRTKHVRDIIPMRIESGKGIVLSKPESL